GLLSVPGVCAGTAKEERLGRASVLTLNVDAPAKGEPATRRQALTSWHEYNIFLYPAQTRHHRANPDPRRRVVSTSPLAGARKFEHERTSSASRTWLDGHGSVFSALCRYARHRARGRCLG